ncbi:ER membrane protein complex subunit 2 [Diplonema papillatum]|nr:ER membrane protein complex subunit 2 [Diplonema papillatum]
MECPSLNEVASLSSDRLLKVLKELRMHPVRKSELVVKIGERLIAGSAMGADKWNILEQVAIAAMDVLYFDLASRCIAMLAAKFGGSARRVLRLKGMLCEAQGDYAAAEPFYKSILEKNPTDRQVKWRQVAILKAQGRFDEAIKELEAQMKITQMAEEGYIELMNLHLNSKHPDYDKALTNCEELILQNPTSYCWLMLCAEILCTGKPTSTNFLLARKYYCESILQNDGPNNMRSFWGLWNVCKNLRACGASTTENADLMKWAEERILSTYEKMDCPQKEYAALLFKDEVKK